MSATHPIIDQQSAPIQPVGLPTHEVPADIAPVGDKDRDKSHFDEVTVGEAADVDAGIEDDGLRPTEEDLLTLRKISAPLPWVGVGMCIIEFAERASYYGSIGPFNNFINNALPIGGNGAGAVAPGEAGLEQSAGALGQGSVTASALVNMFQFLAYVVPVWGGIIADTRWGRFKTICIGTAVGALAHFILVIPAIPQVIAKPDASLGTFIVSILSLAWAAGFIKPSLAPLLCDQSPVKRPTLKVLASGERVIVDPNVTIERYLLVFYWCINVGAFFALATSYTSRHVGFWLSFLLPGLLYMLMPIVLLVISKKLYKAPPQGSVVLETFKVIRVTLSDGGWGRMWKGGSSFWDRAKPSFIRERDGGLDVDKVFWDDKFVDEVAQTMRACAVFLLIPIFAMGNGGIGNSLNSMSTAMRLEGVPNDLISNFNPLSIIVFAPILNYGLYPFMARIGYPLKPMTRMCIGFLLASCSDVVAAIVQWRVYETSPCGWYATTGVCEGGPSSMALWYQIPIIMLPAIGELFVNVTSYELAYTRSPARMKGLVYALALFNHAIAAAISLALANAVQDPYLVWPWAALACATFVTAWVFPTYFKHLNTPVGDFADRERMAGMQQPKAIAERREKA